jgi:para-aminobenzoate synthetase component 1
LWLDSGDGESLDYGGRYHILVADPRVRVISEAGVTQVIHRDGKTEETREDVLQVLRKFMGPLQQHQGELPFSGGAVGYLSYDYGRRLQGMPVVSTDIPEVAMGIYDWAIVIDGQQHRCWLTGELDTVPDELHCALGETDSRNRKKHVADLHLSKLRHETSEQDYVSSFQRIQYYLTEGDCYQVNYAQRFSASFKGDSWSLYLAMREANPSPYGAYLPLPFTQILSSSPEQFLSLQAREVRTRPIKGTRPRHRDTREDQRLAEELQNSAKDKAENLMIVDLLRNDLGRVCVPGSIGVPELFKVESYPTVHHLVSTITGTLAETEDAWSLLAACFPGGSITGAPKYRAMEIIGELEQYPRQIYCGSIVRVGFDGNMDSNIAIRTIQINDDQAGYHAGGGIVADSRLEEEYQESLDKAAAFFALFAKSQADS